MQKKNEWNIKKDQLLTKNEILHKKVNRGTSSNSFAIRKLSPSLNQWYTEIKSIISKKAVEKSHVSLWLN